MSKMVKTVDIALVENIYDISSREILKQAIVYYKISSESCHTGTSKSRNQCFAKNSSSAF